MSLAAASGEDLATTSDIVTDALTAFGRTAADSGRLADIMAAASSNANTNVSMMGETFKFAAPVAGALGISMEDTALAVGLMANAGIKASQAGTALRGGLTNLVKPSKQAADAMERYGIEIQKNDDGSVNLRATMEHLRSKFGELSETEQAAAAGAIFGKNAMSGWLAIINGSDEDFNKLADAIDNSDGAAKSMAETMGDNLQGKLTLLSSATEGLGIALYEKVAEPLSGAVEFATGVVSDLTLALSPAKSDMESFLDDLTESNKQVQQSLDHAKETVSNAETKVAELDAFGSEFDSILSDCDQFNAVTLDDGRIAICNSTGDIVGYVENVGEAATTTEGILDQWASGGLNTSGIKTTSEEAKGMIGYVSEEADTVETRLGKFAEQGIDTKPIEEGTQVIIQAFDETGDEVETFTGDIDEAGKVKFDPKHIEGGTEAVITAFDPATGAVETFKGSIDALSSGEIDMSKIVNEFGRVEDSTRKTYHITDEFTKAKISRMVDLLGDSVDGLAESWNEETGELTASHKELKEWFDTAKQVAMYTALKDALQETYDAWGEAAVNLAKSQSGLAEAQKELDDFIKQSGKTEEELYALAAQAASHEGSQFQELLDNVAHATSEVEKSNAAMTDAENVMNSTTTALQPYVDNMEQLDQAAADSAESTGDAANATGELGDELEDMDEELQNAIKGLQDEYNVTQDLTEQFKNKVVESFDEAKEAATIDFNPFEQWTQNAENGIAKFTESMGTQITGLMTYRDNLAVVRDNMGQISPEFLKYLEDMGVGGAQLVQELADCFRNGDASTAEFLVQQYTDALDMQDDISTMIGLDKVRLMYDLNEMGSSVAEWEGLGRAFDSAVEQVRAGGGELTEETSNAFWDAVNAAKAAGVAIPDGLADAIATSDDPELAVQEAAGQLNDAMWLEAEGLLETAKKAGLQVPEGIATSITEHQGDPTAALDEIVGLMGGKTSDFNTIGTEAGEGMATSAAEGITDKEGDVTGAADGVVQAAKDTASTSSALFRMVGKSSMEMFKSGMKDKETEVKESAVGIVSRTNETVKLYGERVFEATGKSMGEKLADGIGSTANTVTDKVNAMVSDIGTKLTEMTTAVSNACSDMAATVSNTYLRFPNIQIPHVRWTWERLDYGDGAWTSYPNFYVDWFAKAMDNGMILDQATIFGMANGRLLGAGEAGSETVVGTKSLMGMIETAVQDAVAPEAAFDDVSRKLDSLIAILGQYMPEVVDGMQSGMVFEPDGSYMGKFRKKLSSEIAMDVRRARA